MINKNIVPIIKELNLVNEVQKGNFGLEKENLRVDKMGHLALTPHPSVFGDKKKNPYITVDFSESQVEMITPSFKKVKDVYYFMENLHDIVTDNLEEEYLWPQSLPPVIPEEDKIPVAQFKQDKASEEYRDNLAKKYGKYLQLLSGIHYNFSFDTDFIKEFYEKSNTEESYKDFKNNLYMKVARNYMKHSWLLVYLLGASGVVHKSYNPNCIAKLQTFDKDLYYFENGISFRNSICGYRNKKELYISHNSLEEYINDIKSHIADGTIQGAREYYSSLRLKSKDASDLLGSLEKDGIEYLEVRSIDLNPFARIGIELEDMEFIHLFLMHMLLKGECSFTKEDYLAAKENEKMLATHGLDKEFTLTGVCGGKFKVTDLVLAIFDEMITNFKELGIYDEKMKKTFEFQLKKVNNVENLYLNRLLKSVKEEGYINFHLHVAEKSLDYTRKNSFSLKNYEDMELSTQILIKDAIKRGVKFEIVDRNENFISLSKNGKKEYVKQATKTSKDSYISMLIMENKVVSKKVLSENGIKVPAGNNYDNIDEAKEDFKKFEGKKIVVKPKSTNFGLGISIFQNGFTKEEYFKALEIAFSEDKSVLVEEFISGREFRFLVIGDEVAGILHRVPANIVGDGKKTIRELVKIKNESHLRGTHYEKPLQKIKLGEIEKLLLSNQGKDFEYVPAENEIVYLRENSNISTGGDSIDFTDEIPEIYKKIAVKAAKSANVVFCGVDIMINDIKNENPEGNYAVIEINFNPAIHIHCYPAVGKNRKIGDKILNVLGF